jgi:hypothetical protein
MGKKYVFFFVFFFSFVWPSWKEEEEEDREQTLKDEFVHQSLPYNFFFFCRRKRALAGVPFASEDDSNVTLLRDGFNSSSLPGFFLIFFFGATVRLFLWFLLRIDVKAEGRRDQKTNGQASSPVMRESRINLIIIFGGVRSSFHLRDSWAFDDDSNGRTFSIFLSAHSPSKKEEGRKKKNDWILCCVPVI